jgi:hypothetical protein
MRMYESVIRAIVDETERGEVPWVCPSKTARYSKTRGMPANSETGHSNVGINVSIPWASRRHPYSWQRMSAVIASGLMRREAMRCMLAGAALLGLLCQSDRAFGYACNHSYYVNSSGHVIHSPSCGAKNEGVRHAQCRDGSVSYSEHHRGTCSHHGGVSNWE